MRRRSRFERLGNRLDAIGRMAERKQWHSDPAMNRLRRACHGVIVLAAIFGLMPFARFDPVLLPGVALALATIIVAIFAVLARTAPVMLFRTFLAVLLLVLTGIVSVVLSKYAFHW